METRDLSGAPVAPDDFNDLYNSYVTDPLFGRRFTIVWVVGTFLFFVLYSPHLLRNLRTGRIWQGWALYERVQGGYRLLDDIQGPSEKTALRSGDAKGKGKGRPGVQGGQLAAAFFKGAIDSFQLRMVRHTNLDFGQIIVLLAYLAALLVCVIYQAPLAENSNRAGFLALAQFPFVFLYAAKSSPVTLLLGRGYEKLNFLHRWAGRALMLTAIIHGSLWIRFRIVNNETDLLLHGSKERRGQASLALICIIVLTSLRPIRRLAYNYFFAFHQLVTAGFFISVCYHTPYAVPWVIPPAAFYSFDFLARLIRMRLKDAYLEAPDNQLTFIRVPDVSGGWVAGQHVRLRVFFDGRLFEAHPLTICNAPPAITNFKDGRGLMLAARVCGDWTSSLNALARSELTEDKIDVTALLRGRDHTEEEDTPVERTASVMIDGPYGGPSIDFATTSENVLLIAGGSGVTFTLGLLDDLVGRVAIERREDAGEGVTRTRRIKFIWCIRSYGHIKWFAPQFQAIAHTASDPKLDLSLEFVFYVTCACDPTRIPDIPKSEVVQAKPIVSTMIDDFVTPGPASGGLGVAAAGPESLTSDARNAVAALGPLRARRFGGVELHTESYTL